ncbi:MAG: hypothetical protein PHC85_02540 [Candidatus Pacebacteria bacterium]|nr:hypothetical protein [Candidatus Paceibacterota bacterium]
MCGIFGVLRKTQSDLNPDLLMSVQNHLFTLSESRGKEASGVALLSGNAIQICKDAVPASKLIKSKTYQELFSGLRDKNTANPFAVIGHTRLVTDGGAENNKNNQPVSKSGVVCVHNGIIVNHAELWEKFPSLKRDYKVDTEIIPDLLNFFLKQENDIAEAAVKMFGLIKGTASIATLFDDKNCLLLATNNGSLYFCLSETQNTCLFASERNILEQTLKKNYFKKIPGNFKIQQVESNTGFVIHFSGRKAEKFSFSGGNKIPVASSGKTYKIMDVSPNKNGGVVFETKKPDQAKIEKLIIEEFEENAVFVDKLKRCTKCVLPETMPFIEFDEKGVCNYCRNHKTAEKKGEEALKEIILKNTPKNEKPKCLFPFSGGRDSSYGLHYVKNVLKIEPIAYSYDWGMVTDLARRNQARICGELGIEHIIVSADIRRKRENIKKNIIAWLKKPDLGMVPLFMAGDKQYFYHINRLEKQLGTDFTIYSENPLEKTDFKSGFNNIRSSFSGKNIHKLPFFDTAHLAMYYFKQFLLNPSYINSSLIDTFSGFLSHYTIPHNYLFLYHYIAWDEKKINSTLIDKYDWETAKDTDSTWRIGDGTAPFYNYIYHTVAGFTENDTFRSNQIREGVISREEGLKLIREENKPRIESIKWYCETIGIDFEKTLKTINNITKLYKA